jgi:hypothetical protein
VFAFRPPVAASHGSFWVNGGPDVKVVSLVAAKVSLDVNTPAASVAEFLAANVGKQVSLQMGGAGGGAIEGKLVDVKLSAPRTDTQDPYMPGGLPGAPGASYGRAGQFALIQTKDGYVALNPQSVTSARLSEGEPGRDYTVQQNAVGLRGTLAQPAPGKALTVSWLAKGATWAPSYMVDISDPKQARFSAKAVVINEAADFSRADLSLVTGMPHLLMADVVSPLAMKQDMAAFIGALVRGSSSQEQQRYSMASQMVSNSAAYIPPAAAGLPAFNANAPGAAAEDLFLYPLKSVDLAKGETGCYPLLDASVPYRHIHLWDIPDYVNEQEYYDQQRQQAEEPVVWHALRLTNNTSIPWTTAPAETVSGGQVLGQDGISYTPVGADTTLKITVAVDVKADQTEFERERKVNAVNVRGVSYDRVTVDGRLSLRNLKREPVTVEITKMLTGEVQSSKPEAKVEKLARGLRGVNSRDRLSWTVTVAPGEEQQVEYTYEVLVRR